MSPDTGERLRVELIMRTTGLEARQTIDTDDVHPSITDCEPGEGWELFIECSLQIWNSWIVELIAEIQTIGHISTLTDSYPLRLLSSD